MLADDKNEFRPSWWRYKPIIKWSCLDLEPNKAVPTAAYSKRPCVCTESLSSLSVWSSLFVNNLKMCPGFLSEHYERLMAVTEGFPPNLIYHKHSVDKVHCKLSASNLCANFLTLSDPWRISHRFVSFCYNWDDTCQITTL